MNLALHRIEMVTTFLSDLEWVCKIAEHLLKMHANSERHIRLIVTLSRNQKRRGLEKGRHETQTFIVESEDTHMSRGSKVKAGRQLL